MRATTIARILVLSIACVFAVATAEAVSVTPDKAAVVKQTPSIDMASAMHEAVNGIEGKLMSYEFYRCDTWSKIITVPSHPRKRPEPAPN